MRVHRLVDTFLVRGHVMRKPSLFICEQQRCGLTAPMRRLISAYLVRSLDSTVIFVFTFLCVESYEVKSDLSLTGRKPKDGFSHVDVFANLVDRGILMS